MKLQKPNRRKDPAKNARVLLVEREAGGLDRVSSAPPQACLVPPTVRTEPMRRSRALPAFRSANSADRMECEARAPSMHDEVTGQYRRRFRLEMVAEARRGERGGRQPSALIAARDELRSLRDRLGEARCDRLMAYSPAPFKHSLREAEVTARFRRHLGMRLARLPTEGRPMPMERLTRRFPVAVDGRPPRAGMAPGSATSRRRLRIGIGRGTVGERDHRERWSGP